MLFFTIIVCFLKPECNISKYWTLATLSGTIKKDTIYFQPIMWASNLRDVSLPLQVLYIIEEDKGDGWTRARKQSGEEGYVPTSYVEITMEKNSKGAVTYI